MGKEHGMAQRLERWVLHFGLEGLFFFGFRVEGLVLGCGADW